MTAHAKVTVIGHSASGAGQVWYRVTGAAGIGNLQLAYRAGTGPADVRRVRFVGAGATARLVGFRPGELLRDEADLVAIERAFSGEYLTRGVKTQRSRFARLPAAPIQAAVLAAVATAGLDPVDVFSTRNARAWWRAVDRAARLGRSVSFLSADGVLRASGRSGVTIDWQLLHTGLGVAVRERMAGPVAVGRSRPDAITQLDLAALVAASLSDKELGERVWEAARAAASRREIVGNAGYELTLTLPKSFSLYAMTGNPERDEEWLDVMEVAATHALERLMTEAGFCSTGHRGDGADVTIMPADGWAGFIATEISSRAGDPHLHVHCTLPNVLVGRDGIVRTMADGGRELIVNAPRFAAWGQEYAIAEAAARGLVGDVRFDASTRQWEVGGFSDETITAFSRGREAVRREEDDTADGIARTARSRSRRQRQAKTRITGAKEDAQPSWSQVRATVEGRAARLGLDLATPRDGPPERRWLQPTDWSDAEWIGWVSHVACEHDSVASLAKIKAVTDLATAGMPADERQRIAQLVLREGFERAHASRDRGMRNGGQQWVARFALDAETTLIERMAASTTLRPTRTKRTDVAVNAFEIDQGWRLSAEQQEAVTAIVDGVAPLTLISGVGGSGKTSVLAAARLGLDDPATGLLVTSTATRAAATAGHASGAPWTNLAALMWRVVNDKPLDAHVIVVDEASMADVTTISRLAGWCTDHGKRLVLQGDHAQLPAVGAGDAFNVLCQRFPESVVRLATNQRQRTESGRAIAAALHAGDIDTAWDRIVSEGAVLVAHNRDHKLSLVAEAVTSQIAKGGPASVTCDAVTRAEVDDLNRRIHDELLARGVLDPDRAVAYRGPNGNRRLAPGTVLRVAVPVDHREPNQRLTRGELATVIDPGRDRVQLRFGDGRERSLTPATVLRHMAYGYAGTTHTVQGQTSEVHIAAVDPNKDTASLYVSASRARQQTIYVADARDWLTPDEMQGAAKWAPRDLTDEVLDRVCTRLRQRTHHLDSPTAALSAPIIRLDSPGLGL